MKSDFWFNPNSGAKIQLWFSNGQKWFELENRTKYQNKGLLGHRFWKFNLWFPLYLGLIFDFFPFNEIKLLSSKIWKNTQKYVFDVFEATHFENPITFLIRLVLRLPNPNVIQAKFTRWGKIKRGIQTAFFRLIEFKNLITSIFLIKPPYWPLIWRFSLRSGQTELKTKWSTGTAFFCLTKIKNLLHFWLDLHAGP